MAAGYITSVSLNPYLVDKDTGAPLSGGYIQFWKDSDRTVPKLVYQKVTTGTDPVSGDPVYEYVALPNPIQLSAVGTIQNAIGDNVALYYYPFDDQGNVELYYVAVFNSLGVQQFVREGWPGSGVSGAGSDGGAGADNMLSNSQFVEVLFNTATGLTYTSTGSADVVFPIAPDWDLLVTFSGIGTLTVNRLAIAGNANLETNPPYVLSINAGSNIASVVLRQRLEHNPGIWSAITSGDGGYIAAFMLLGPSTNAVMNYDPSVGAVQQLVAGNNVSAEYTSYSNTVQLTPSANTDTADVGYVDILISLSSAGTSLITSIQVLGLETEIDGVAYIQEPVNRQIDHLFNYYNEKLQYKPIPSWLIGWDFPMNPTQFLGASVAAQAVGANKSYYAWDQTIAFQSVDSGLTISRDSTGGLKVLAALAGQHALVQYLPANIAKEMLSRSKCVMVCANGSVAVSATVSLWYLKGTSTLPSTVTSNNSIVATLDANGYPATLNTPGGGTWVQVPRSNLGGSAITNTATNAALFTIPVTPTGGSTFNQIPLNGWDMLGSADILNATYFAIVIGTASLAQNDYVVYQAITCQDGDIPTIPAPKTKSAHLQDCQQFYWSTFPYGVVPAQAAGLAGCIFGRFGYFYNGASNSAASFSVNVEFPVQMIATPTTMTTYNPINANANWYNNAIGADSGTATLYNANQNNFGIIPNIVGTDNPYNDVYIHVSADARLGQ